MVVPVGPNFDRYAEEVQKKLYEAGFMSEVDTDAGDTLNKKIRNAQLAQFNFILGNYFEMILVFSSVLIDFFCYSCWRKRGEQQNSKRSY